MKRIISQLVTILSFVMAGQGVAGGLSYALTLEKAQAQLRADPSKHILVIYTEAW